MESLGAALGLARRLRGAAGRLKIGSQLFAAAGPAAVKSIAKLGFGVFLDLKFHDIPNTVGGAVAEVAKLPGIRLLTLHACGGAEMMRAGREAADRAKNPPKLLAVTILTSLNQEAMQQIGFSGSPADRALELAILAKRAGMDGVVASAHELSKMRAACGPEFLLVVPGIRPRSAALDDQARVATPEEAIRAGADYLVLGRPIIAAQNPRAAALAVASEIAAAARAPIGERA